MAVIHQPRTTAGSGSTGLVVSLHAGVRQSSHVGDHAATLSAAAKTGVAVARGAVLTTRAVDQIRAFGLPAIGYAIAEDTHAPPEQTQVAAAVRELWHRSGRGGLVGTDLTTSTSGSAGTGTHQVGTDIDDWSQYLHALRRVIATTPTDVPLAIVAQRHLRLTLRGDAQAGHPGTPWAATTVSFDEDPGATTRLGALGITSGHTGAIPLDRQQRRRLRTLTRNAARALDPPAFIRWGLDTSGWLWLLSIDSAPTPARSGHGR